MPPPRKRRRIHRTPDARPGPPGGKRDENRRRRTREIAAAALQLFLARGIESVTIDEIVVAAGVAKGSFYRYFDDKAALVRALLAPVAGRLADATARCEIALQAARSKADLLEAYQALAGALAAGVFEAPDVVLLYLQENRAPGVDARAPVVELAAQGRAGALRLTEAAQAHGLLRPLDARVSAVAVTGAVERLLYGFLKGEDLGAPGVIPGALISLVLDGLRERDPPRRK